MTQSQSAQQAQFKEDNTYIEKSWEQYNAPILIIIMLCDDMSIMHASNGVHAMLVLEPTECSTSTRQRA